MKSLHAIILKRGPLTAKETTVLAYLCEGYQRKEIALRTFRSPSTVAKHVETIAQKFEAHCTAEIVAKAVANGMVEITYVETCSKSAIAIILLLSLIQAVQSFDHQPYRLSRTAQARVMRLVRVRREIV